MLRNACACVRMRAYKSRRERIPKLFDDAASNPAICVLRSCSCLLVYKSAFHFVMFSSGGFLSLLCLGVTSLVYLYPAFLILDPCQL